MRFQPEGYDANGKITPNGVGVRLREGSDGPTARQLAQVYLYASGMSQELREADLYEAEERSLPCSGAEMAAALNALIDAAGSELVWVPPTEGVPPEVTNVVDQVVAELRRRGINVGEVQVVPIANGVIPHQADGDAHPEHDGREKYAQREREERDRYRRLASTVLEGLRRIYAVTADEEYETTDRDVLESVRTMAGAIGEGDLIAAIDRWFVENGYAAGPGGVERDHAERLARAILSKQLTTGTAQVPWEERGGSREARIAAAETILRADRVGAVVGRPVASAAWREGVSGALMAEQGIAPHTASGIARTAQEVLMERPDWYVHQVVSEAATTAEAS